MELAASVFVIASFLTSTGVPLEKLVDNTDLPPGVEPPFSVGESAESCGSSVYYLGSTQHAIGIYSVSPTGIAVVANESVPFPGTNDTFARAVRPSCTGNDIVFIGLDDVGPMSLGATVFRYRQGEIQPVLERGTPIGGSPLYGLDFLDANDHSLVVDARLQPAAVNQAIVYMPFDGEPTIVADRSMVMPGQTSPVTIMGEPILVGSDVVFRARTRQSMGLYRWRQDDGLSLIADTATPVPVTVPGQGTFYSFGLTANLDDGVVFGADYFDGLGLFRAAEGGLEPLILPGEETAEGETLVAAFRPTGAGDLLSFKGWTLDLPFRDVIYVRTPDGILRRLIGVGDVIEGKEVFRVTSFANDRDVLVWVRLLDTDQPTTTTVLYRARFGSVVVEIPTLDWRGAIALIIVLVSAAMIILRQARGAASAKRC